MADKLTKIRIENFRGIREGEIDGLTDVNILVGRNNSGKSTVLEAISISASLMYQLDPAGRDRQEQIRTRRNESAFPAPSWWYRRDQALQPRFVLWSDGDRVEARVDETRQLRIQKSQATAAAIVARTVLFDTVDARRLEFEQRWWTELATPRRDKVLIAIMNEIFGFDAETASYTPEQQVMLLFPKIGVRVDDQGDGARACFRVLLVMLAVKPSLLLLEEPETHQHPAALEKAALAVCKAAKEAETQLILTSHSRECVRYYLDAAKASGLIPTVFHLGLSAGKLETRRIPAESTRELLDTGPDIRFLDLYG